MIKWQQAIANNGGYIIKENCTLFFWKIKIMNKNRNYLCLNKYTAEAHILT